MLRRRPQARAGKSRRFNQVLGQGQVLRRALGVPLGVVAGYYRGGLDQVIMRLTDAWLAFPFLILAIGLVTILGPSLTNATLAIGVAFFYLTQQNYTLFNGYQGFARIEPPTLFGLDLSAPRPFYYVCLAVSTAAVLGVMYVSRSTFGIALQAIRDNETRARFVGISVRRYRWIAFMVSGGITSIPAAMPSSVLMKRSGTSTVSEGPRRVAKISETRSLVDQLAPKSAVSICLTKITSCTP